MNALRFFYQCLRLVRWGELFFFKPRATPQRLAGNVNICITNVVRSEYPDLIELPKKSDSNSNIADSAIQLSIVLTTRLPLFIFALTSPLIKKVMYVIVNEIGIKATFGSGIE